jgi:hypothetical protein
MSLRDVHLVQGVIFRTYFKQFAEEDVADVSEADENNSENKFSVLKY